MSHGQVSMVTHAFNWQDSAGSGFENMTCSAHHTASEPHVPQDVTAWIAQVARLYFCTDSV